MKMLDIRIAGIHSLCYEYGTIEENTHGMVQVISNPFIHIISHPGDGTAAYILNRWYWQPKNTILYWK